MVLKKKFVVKIETFFLAIAEYSAYDLDILQDFDSSVVPSFNIITAIILLVFPRIT